MAYLDKKRSSSDLNHEHDQLETASDRQYTHSASSSSYYRANPQYTAYSPTANGGANGHSPYSPGLRDYNPSRVGPPPKRSYTAYPPPSNGLNGNANGAMLRSPRDYQHYTGRRTESPPASAYFTSHPGTHNGEHVMEPISATEDVGSHFSFSTTLRRHTVDDINGPLEGIIGNSNRILNGGPFPLIPAGPPDGIIRRLVHTLGIQRFFDQGQDDDNSNLETGRAPFDSSFLNHRSDVETPSLHYAHLPVQVCFIFSSYSPPSMLY